MHQLNHTDLDAMEARLQADRAALLESIGARLHGRDEDAQRALFNHFADGDSPVEAVMLEDIDVAVLQHDFAELRAIDAALKRIDFGAAGTCTVCGGPIQVERLRAQPTAHTCIECQGALEARAARGAA
jgi:RNA polymerase-binding transcription factor DksA